MARTDRWTSPHRELLEGIGDNLICNQLSGGQWMRVRLPRTLSEDFKNQERMRLKAVLDTTKQLRKDAIDERQKQIDRQERRNQRGVTAAARGGMPKILIGRRMRRALTNPH